MSWRLTTRLPHGVTSEAALSWLADFFTMTWAPQENRLEDGVLHLARPKYSYGHLTGRVRHSGTEPGKFKTVRIGIARGKLWIRACMPRTGWWVAMVAACVSFAIYYTRPVGETAAEEDLRRHFFHTGIGFVLLAYVLQGFRDLVIGLLLRQQIKREVKRLIDQPNTRGQR
jgi:hypothetical protein